MFDWQSFLDKWNSQTIAALRKNGTHTDDERRILRRGNTLFPPASQIELKNAERRLQTRLPTNYCDFLLTSNGLFVVNERMTCRLLSTEELGWYRDREPTECAAWSMDVDLPSVPDSEYFVYDKNQDIHRFRREHVTGLLCISESVEYGTYLLNPKVTTNDGEWEAWDLSPQEAGAIRYRTFYDLLSDNYSLIII